MGVFPIINRINHSCLPNCSVQWNPVTDKEELFTAREVEAGEELTICYLDMVTNVSSREERRDYLERHFGFLCNCPLCSLEVWLCNDWTNTNVHFSLQANGFKLAIFGSILALLQLTELYTDCFLNVADLYILRGQSSKPMMRSD